MAEYLIRAIDLETSGRPEDTSENFMPEVVEIARTDLTLVVEGERKAYRVGETSVRRFGVSQDMAPEVIAVHHIRNEDIAGLPVATLEDLGAFVTEGSPLYLTAHKADFERHFLPDEICGGAKWICTFKAAKHLYEGGPYGLQVLKYGLGLGHLPHDRCMPPHAAGPDTYVGAHVLGEFLLMESGRQLEAWTREPEYHPVCPIGEKQGWKGKPWGIIDHGFLDWMLKQPSMEPDLKHAARLELDLRRQRQAAHLIETQKD